MRNWLDRERTYFFNWVPVFLGCGIVFNLSFTTTAGVLIIVSLLLGSGLLIAFTRSFYFLRSLVPIGLLIMAGFLLAALRVQSVSSPTIPALELKNILIEGQIVEREKAAYGERYLIKTHYMENLSGNEQPVYIRAVWRGKVSNFQVGSIIRGRAVLSKPPQRILPDGYNFSRQLFFDKIGGVGYFTDQPELVFDVLSSNSLPAQIEIVRSLISDRIRTKLLKHNVKPQVIEVCIALITGKRTGIAEQTEAVMRDSGLAHLLAISGLHVGLICGIIFFSVRLLLACWEWAALHWPIKKIASVAAILVGGGYFLISGGNWSTQRAFIMVVIMFSAIIFDRKALSLRNVAIAACIILLLKPEAILQVGFQMSFAAVTVLIAAYEFFQKSSSPESELNLQKKNVLWEYCKGILATSFLAGIGTSPFSMFHFNRLAVYGLLGNLLAMPIMAFWVMPAAILGGILLVFNLDGFAWLLMAWGVELIISLASWVSSLPGAIKFVPQISVSAFILLIVGGVISCLSVTFFRFVGVGIYLLGVLVSFSHQQVNIFISGDGKNHALFLPDINDKKLIVSSTGKGLFAKEQWQRYAGLPIGKGNLIPIYDLARDINSIRCVKSYCDIQYQGHSIRLYKGRVKSASCSDGDLIIAPKELIPTQSTDGCSALVIDKAYLKKHGAVTISLNEKEIVLKKPTKLNKPWE